jgi:hypothetical protein
MTHGLFPNKGLPLQASSFPGLSGEPRLHPQTVGGLHLGRPDKPGDDEERVCETAEKTSPIANHLAPIES